MKRYSSISPSGKFRLIQGLILISILFCFTPLFAQQHSIDSLVNLLKSDKEDTNKVNHLNRISSLCINAGLDEKSMGYADSAISLAQKTNHIAGLVQAYIELGYANQDKGNANAAVEYGLKALNAEEKIGNKRVTANIFNVIGTGYFDRADYPNSLLYFFKALAIAESTRDTIGTAQTVGNIGNIYEHLNDTAKAMYYFQKTLKLWEELGNKMNVAIAYLNLGTSYDVRHQYDKALDCFLKAYRMAEEIKFGDVLPTLLLNIADEYAQKGQQDTALHYLFIALDVNQGNSLINIASIKSTIGGIYLKKKMYKQAEQYMLDAIDVATKGGYFDQEKNIYTDLSSLYSQTGQWQKAFENQSKLLAVNDSLINTDKSKEIGALEAKSEYDKQLTIQQAEADKNKALADAETKRQRVIILLIAAIALSVVLVAILIYRSLKLTKKEKLLVERQKVLLELKALRAQMNPHFIFNAINSIQLFILENDSEAAHEHLATFSQLIRMVLENSRFETISLSEEIKMLELYLELEDMRFSSKFSFKINVDKSIEKENTLISPLIIQPYVENAIWHGLMHLEGRKGEITISFERMNGQMKVSIDDNGIGRKRSMELKEGSTHESMGLTITRERLEIIKMLYKSNMSVNFIDKTDTDGSSLGTRVELLMPYISNTTSYA